MRGVCEPTNDHGVPYVQWMHALFGDCVYGTRETSSVLLGYASILCWLNAQLPQIYENYKLGSTDSLSFPFLINWLLGDITNLGGAIILDQLPFQIYLAWYFCIVDFALLWQYIYYTYIRPPPARLVRVPVDPVDDVDDDVDDDPMSERQSLIGREPVRPPGDFVSHTFPMRRKGERAHRQSTSIIFLAVLLLTFNQPSPSTIVTSPLAHDSLVARSLPEWDEDDIPWPTLSIEIIGRIMAWTCTVLYLTSRMPQIFKNWTRGSVEGLSISMFIFAALGNFNYTMSIILNPANSTSKALRQALPYLLGSSGTLMFDCTIYAQWVYYGRLERWRQKQAMEMDVEGGQGMPERSEEGEDVRLRE